MIMATDLPNRPKHDPDAEQTIIDPMDRVKSAQDKPDPRFEAARKKSEREAKVYADRAEKADDPDADVDETDEEAEVTDESAEKGTFSFNMTAGEVEEDE
jgi:hypothetical protein